MNKLIKYIESHGIDAIIVNGQLMGCLIWTKDGQTGHTWEPIEPTIKAVRAWLGY